MVICSPGIDFAEILTVPKNMKLIALPLFELYDNAVRYVTPYHSINALY